MSRKGGLCFVTSYKMGCAITLYITVIFETDCKTLVENLKGGRNNITECGVVIDHIKQILNAHPGFMIQFASKNTNKVTHSSTQKKNNKMLIL